MKSEFLTAITQLSAEKNLPAEAVFQAVEAALASAFKKDNLAASNVVVRIDPETGAVHVYTRKEVVEEPEDPRIELSVDEARRYKPDAKLGDAIDFETTPHNAGRIAAQTAKQVVLQRLREAEREVVFDEYSGKEGDILSGVVQRVESRHVIIDLGKAEAVLPPAEQVRTEHYRPGQRLKVYMVEVLKANKGPQVLVSRTHKNLLRRLFELEVPEIFKGVVELKAIAREAGYRSKVAVTSRQDGVDPVGACVGLRGIRIQNIVNELNGERIDVVQWDPDPARFVAHALSPAQVLSVETRQDENTAEVIVPDRQLSLAIGREGQNARLAAKLTGWRIDIKSQTAAEEAGVGVVTAPAAEAEAEEVAASAEAEAPAEAPAEPVVAEEAVEPAVAAEEAPAEEPVEEETEAVAAEAEAEPVAVGATEAKPQIRFAEDILAGAAPVRAEGKGKRGKAKKAGARDEEGREAKPKKGKRPRRVAVEEEDELEDYAV
jgi:N utilization substance protein A